VDTLECPKCGEQIELSSALQGKLKADLLKAEHDKHEADIAKLREEEAEKSKLAIAAATESASKKATDAQEMAMKTLRDEMASEKENNTQMRKDYTELMQELREERKARENAELNAQKKLLADESKIREDAAKDAQEKERMTIKERDKTISDLEKALNEMQRKASVRSQQMQGEVSELDLEEALAEAFREDVIEPVAKGVKGADIKQTVRSQLGTDCGVVLWEVKRTKDWKDAWVITLKTFTLLAKVRLLSEKRSILLQLPIPWSTTNTGEYPFNNEQLKTEVVKLKDEAEQA
jgi:hypothetical protein